MQKWTANADATPLDVSVLLSKEYLKAYNGGVYGTSNVTFSALDVSKVNNLNQSTAKLVAHLNSLGSEAIAQIKIAAQASQEFYYSDYKDIGDFLKRVEALPIKTDSQLITQVNSDLKSAVLTTDNSTERFAAATGLSIWMPTNTSTYLQRYQGLQFDKESHWSEFLTTLTAAAP